MRGRQKLGLLPKMPLANLQVFVLFWGLFWVSFEFWVEFGFEFGFESGFGLGWFGWFGLVWFGLVATMKDKPHIPLESTFEPRPKWQVNTHYTRYTHYTHYTH
jgi:hypothetical protein